jgi:hypothetical protein
MRRGSLASLDVDVSTKLSSEGLLSKLKDPLPSSPLKTIASPERDDAYKIKRKAPLPWKQPTVADVPVVGYFSLDTRDAGSIDLGEADAGGTIELPAILDSEESSVPQADDAPLFVCSVCNMTFKSNGSLERHEKFSVSYRT